MFWTFVLATARRRVSLSTYIWLSLRERRHQQRRLARARALQGGLRVRLTVGDTSDEQCLAMFRLDREGFREVVALVRPAMQPCLWRADTLDVEVRVAAALCWLATSSFQRVARHAVGISQPSMSRALNQFLDAMMARVSDYIVFPSTPQEWERIQQWFYNASSMPGVLGAVDCMHIGIIAPRAEPLLYMNRKGNNSVNVQVVCDADLNILNVAATFPGACHNAYVWRQCGLSRVLSNLPHGSGHLIGDCGYPLRPWLLTSYLHPRGAAQQRYNRVHTRARNAIERCFGVLKMRFRCLDHTGGSVPMTPGRVCKLRVVCCMLHNITRRRQLPLPEDIPLERDEQEDAGQDVERRSVDSHGQRRRDTLVQEYFA
ncbi:putative nuclease HARBI1 [Latimeria chalumnae]|uniref:putative nuclease HARBI1 n=1 Tax=Latimeria chalumnae TaxID=7897 RepID=UPI00313C05A6